MRALVAALVLAVASPAYAFVEVEGEQAPLEPVARPAPASVDREGGTERPEARVEPALPEPLSLVANRVTVEVHDQIAVVRVEHVIQSNSDKVLQARYVLPLGERAHVMGYAIWEKGVKLPGELMEVSRAESLYREVTGQELASTPDETPKVREFRWRPRDPGILRQIGTSAFETHVYPFLPWQLRQVEVLYGEVVPARDGTCTFRFPFDAASAFRNPAASVELDVTLHDTSGVSDATCDWPGATVAREGGALRVRFSGRDVPAKPFCVSWRQGLTPLGATALAHRSGQEPGHALVRVALPLVENAAPSPLDVALVVDRCGAWRGPKAARRTEALGLLVAALRPEDRLVRVDFAGSARRLDPSPRPLDEAFLRDVLVGLAPREGSGRCSLEAALSEAFRALGPREKGRRRLVVLSTDGVTCEARETLLAIEPAGARLLVVGSGHDDDAELLGRLAERHGGALWIPGCGERRQLWSPVPADLLSQPYGASLVAGPARDPSPLLARFREPAVTSATLDDPAGDLRDVRLAEDALSPGATACFLFRYARSGERRLRFHAVVDGEPVAREVALTLPEAEPAHRFVAAFWAKARADDLLRQNPWGRDDPNRAEVVALSLEHRFVTPYTALLSLPDAERRRLHLKEGQPEDGIKLFTFAAATPEAETWILVGTGLLVALVAARKRGALALEGRLA